uniref:SAC domain-containing protein n=1 Tax=Macrostomum lignano TaxID=282301 RepID=A0A1I8FFF9_9PLAT
MDEEHLVQDDSSWWDAALPEAKCETLVLPPSTVGQLRVGALNYLKAKLQTQCDRRLHVTRHSARGDFQRLRDALVALYKGASLRGEIPLPCFAIFGSSAGRCWSMEDGSIEVKHRHLLAGKSFWAPASCWSARGEDCRPEDVAQSLVSSFIINFMTWCDIPGFAFEGIRNVLWGQTFSSTSLPDPGGAVKFSKLFGASSVMIELQISQETAHGAALGAALASPSERGGLFSGRH